MVLGRVGVDTDEEIRLLLVGILSPPAQSDEDIRAAGHVDRDLRVSSLDTILDEESDVEDDVLLLATEAYGSGIFASMSGIYDHDIRVSPLSLCLLYGYGGEDQEK